MRVLILQYPDTMNEAQALNVAQNHALLHHGEEKSLSLGHPVKVQNLASQKKQIWIGAKK